MALKKVTTNVTYRVPAWNYCNMQGNAFGKPSKEKCRFCVKDGAHHRCALYNEVLDVTEGILLKKTRDCAKAVAGFRSIVEDVEETTEAPIVDSKLIVKTTIQEYNKVRKQLISQGYPEVIADKVAYEYMTGGK